MRIGVPKESKNNEFRVGLIPSAVREIVSHGHEVFVEMGAGKGAGFLDNHYQTAGAVLVASTEEIFAIADMVIKVKEPQPNEYKWLRSEQIIFTFLHLAADPAQAEGLMASDSIAIAYETVSSPQGQLPILLPMSEVAGRMSIQAGAACLEKERGGAGLLLGGVPGVSSVKVVILGGGVVGTNAARMALGLGAKVTILDKSLNRLTELDNLFQGQVQTLYSNFDAIEQSLNEAYLVIGSALIPGAATPKLVNEQMVQEMPTGSVVVDVAIDQGGCFETSHPTTHDDPIFIKHGVVHYCVTNMPGAVARTSAYALNHATLPYILAIANKGVLMAFHDDPYLLAGLNIYRGHITSQAVAQALGHTYTEPQFLLPI